MDFGDWGIVLLFAGIAVIFYIIYLVKTSYAKKYLTEAENAMAAGNHLEAVTTFKKALWKANEKPEIEAKILDRLAELYQQHKIDHSFEEYHSLIKQFQVLSKKSSNKAIKEMGEVQSLKKKLIEKMPDLS
jgi:thioredoxin-like negative regulator of GroEL